MAMTAMTILAAEVAVASPDEQLTGLLEDVIERAPATIRFAFSTSGIHDARGDTPLGGELFRLTTKRLDPTIAFDTTRATAWVAGDVLLLSTCVDKITKQMKKEATEPYLLCPKDRKRVMVDGEEKSMIVGKLHVACVARRAGASWQPLACHAGRAIGGAAQAKAVKQGAKLTKLARRTAGAEDVVKLFESTIGDAAMLAKTISDRGDVVLYGSAPDERYVGGEEAAKQLRAWGLTMKVRDGIEAGLAGTNVAWVAANVAASNPRIKSSYRVLAIYEKASSGWKIVQLSFSFPT